VVQCGLVSNGFDFKEALWHQLGTGGPARPSPCVPREGTRHQNVSLDGGTAASRVEALWQGASRSPNPSVFENPRSGVVEIEDGRLVTLEGEAVYAYSSFEGCPWLVETRGRRQTRDSAC